MVAIFWEEYTQFVSICARDTCSSWKSLEQGNDQVKGTHVDLYQLAWFLTTMLESPQVGQREAPNYSKVHLFIHCPVFLLYLFTTGLGCVCPWLPCSVVGYRTVISTQSSSLAHSLYNISPSHLLTKYMLSEWPAGGKKKQPCFMQWRFFVAVSPSKVRQGERHAITGELNKLDESWQF